MRIPSQPQGYIGAVAGAVADNFASFTASGIIQDSGYAASDFAAAAHSHPHGILDTAGPHDDVTHHAPVRGSIIVGNATPKWDILSLGASCNYLHSDGTDVEWSALAWAHLPALTVSRALVTSGAGVVQVAAVTDTELGYLSGVTSALQTQVDGKQPLDSDLTSIAALGSGADKGLYTTGAHVWAEYALTAFARTILDDVDAAAVRATIGVGAGGGDLLADGSVPLTANWDVGAFEIRALKFRSDQATGTAPFIVASTTVVTNLNASLLEGNAAAAFQSVDATLTTIAALGSGADKGIYFTGADVAAEFSLTAFGRSILDDANQAAVRTTLGLTPGTHVQAYDAFLLSIAALGSGADKMVYITGVDTAAEAALSAYGRSLIDDADAAAARTTLGLGGLALLDGPLPVDTGGTGKAGAAVIGDILYASAVDLYSALAKGTKYQKLTMNAAADAPEWTDEERQIILTYPGNLAVGDETPWIPVKFTKPVTLTSIYGVVKTGPTSELSLAVEVCTQANIDGAPSWASILSTPLTIDAGERSSNTAAVAAVLDGTDSVLAVGDHLRLNVGDIGTDGADLTVVLIGKEA